MGRSVSARPFFSAAPFALLGLVLALLLPTGAATAATVIYYSQPENTFGWCTDSSQNAAHSCALGYCQQYGGTDCKAVLECGGGWGAVAFADPGPGVGMVCQRTEARYARQWALLACVGASRSLCWTSSSFTGGNAAPSEQDKAFDETFYAQLGLQREGDELGVADGVNGPQTREAISDYQSKNGLPVTGTADRALVDSLMKAGGGVRSFLTKLLRAIQEQKQDDGLHYAYAPPVSNENRKVHGTD